MTRAAQLAEPKQEPVVDVFEGIHWLVNEILLSRQEIEANVRSVIDETAHRNISGTQQAAADLKRHASQMAGMARDLARVAEWHANRRPR